MWGILQITMPKKSKSIKQWPAPLQHQPRVEEPIAAVPAEIVADVATKTAPVVTADIIKKPKTPKARKTPVETAEDVDIHENDHPAERAKVKARLSRVAGQIAGIQKMVDDDRYCMDILTQIAAARAALDRAGLELLTAHIGGCIAGHGEPGKHPAAGALSQDELIDEVRKVITRFLG
jgi:DNA-binding FrmR family transcriptional regulator